MINSHFAKNEGLSLLLFDLPDINEVVTSVTDLISLQTAIMYQSNNEYQLDIKGTVKLNSRHFTGLELSVHVTGQLGLFAKNRCLNFNLIEGSLQITLKVVNKAVSVGLGGVLGGALNLVNSFTSTSQLLLKAKIQELIQTALVSLNTGFQSITSPVYRHGQSLNYQITAIRCTAESFVIYLELAITGAVDTATKTLNLATKEVTELAKGLVSTIYVTVDFISSFLDWVLDDVITVIQTTPTNAQWQLQRLYQKIEDDISIYVTKTSAPMFNIKSSGSSFLISLGVLINEPTGHGFLKFQVGVEANIAATRNNGLLVLTLDRTSILNTRISSKGVRFASTDDAELLDSIKDLVENVVDNVIRYMQCALDSGFPPSFDSITSYLPPASKCSPLKNDNVYQCDCEEEN